MVDLFRKMATKVGVQLGYEYPINLDNEVTEYISSIREVEKTGNVTNNRMHSDVRTSRH
jgi:hypothetical protein